MPLHKSIRERGSVIVLHLTRASKSNVPVWERSKKLLLLPNQEQAGRGVASTSDVELREVGPHARRHPRQLSKLSAQRPTAAGRGGSNVEPGRANRQLQTPLNQSITAPCSPEALGIHVPLVLQGRRPRYALPCGSSRDGSVGPLRSGGRAGAR